MARTVATPPPAQSPGASSSSSSSSSSQPQAGEGDDSLKAVGKAILGGLDVAGGTVLDLYGLHPLRDLLHNFWASQGALPTWDK